MERNIYWFFNRVKYCESNYFIGEMIETIKPLLVMTNANKVGLSSDVYRVDL